MATSVNKNLPTTRCPACHGEISGDARECPSCSWIVKLIEKHHPTVGQFIDYLYSMALNDGYSLSSQEKFVKEIESLEKRFNRTDPTKYIWFNWQNVWYKVGYAMRMVIEFKETGTIKFYYPNGSIWYKLEYHNGKFIT
jgi:hypothetical protein